MMRAFAISMGSFAKGMLDRRRIGEVHSVFKNSLYVLTKDGRLISIVGPNSYNMPINIRVRLPKGLAIGDLGLSPGAPVRRSGDLLIVGGDLSINLRGAAIWEPTKGKPPALDAAKLLHSIGEIEGVASKWIPSGGLGSLIPHRRALISGDPAGIPLGNPMTSKAALGIAGLFKAIKERDPNGIDRSVRGLIGLGPGLTPSGDDFLMGFFASSMFGMRGRRDRFGPSMALLRRSILRARSLTTPVSQELFLHAIEGGVAEPIDDLIVGIFHGVPWLDRLTRRAIEMGETSGGDIVLGVIMGTSLFI